MKKLLLFLSLSPVICATAQWNTDPAVNNQLCQDAPNIGQNFGNDHMIRLLHDGNGGAFVTWFDQSFATPLSGMDIQLQHISSAGITWPGDGITVSNADYNQRFPEMAPDGSGGVVVTWYSDIDGKTYAQRVDANGNCLWASNGIAVCDYASDQLFPNIIRNENGNVTIVWRDSRGASGYAVYAQQINMNGILLWNSNGVEICSGFGYSSGVSPVQLVTDGNSGVIACWLDTRSGVKPYLQRLLSNGTVSWVADGIPLATINITGCNMVTDGNGGAIVAWTDDRALFNYDVYAQRIDGSGNILWTADGAPVCVRADNQTTVRAAPDGNGGAFIAWNDNRDGIGLLLYGQHMNASGVTQWITGGVEISDQAYLGGGMKLTEDGTGCLLITWTNNNPADLRLQRIDATGTFLLAPGGKVVCSLSSTAFPEITPIGAGNSILAWLDFRNGGQTGIFGSRVLANGALPVRLLAFDGRKESGTVRLNWSTASETDNRGFHIERSADGIHFQNIGFITAHPNNTSGQTYYFIDPQPLTGKNYYRLKQEDVDGHFSYSPIILIRNDATPGVLTIFPNPATNHISIQLPSSDKGELMIINAAGAIVNRMETRASSVSVDITTLPAGTYYCKWNGELVKFIKQAR